MVVYSQIQSPVLPNPEYACRPTRLPYSSITSRISYISEHPLTSLENCYEHQTIQGIVRSYCVGFEGNSEACEGQGPQASSLICPIED